MILILKMVILKIEAPTCPMIWNDNAKSNLLKKIVTATWAENANLGYGHGGLLIEGDYALRVVLVHGKICHRQLKLRNRRNR